MFAFDQVAWTPRLPHDGNLTDKGNQVRYLGIENEKHILIQTLKGQMMKAIAVYFHPIDKNLDPTYTSTNVYATFKQKVTHLPTTIKIGTPHPLQLLQALQYPDVKHWATAHDQEIHKLYKEQVVYWAGHIPANPKPLPLTMTYTYKWQRDVKDFKLKSLCSSRRVLIMHGQPYDSYNTQFPTTEKATARTLIAIAAAQKWKIEHMDICSAYVHEPAANN